MEAQWPPYGTGVGAQAAYIGVDLGALGWALDCRGCELLVGRSVFQLYSFSPNGTVPEFHKSLSCDVWITDRVLTAQVCFTYWTQVIFIKMQTGNFSKNSHSLYHQGTNWLSHKKTTFWKIWNYCRHCIISQNLLNSFKFPFINVSLKPMLLGIREQFVHWFVIMDSVKGKLLGILS